jgi:hypothetical protein
MRRFFTVALFVLLALLPSAYPKDDKAKDEKAQPSALESSKKGWEDLPTSMDGYRRVPAQAGAKLSSKDPWSFSKEGVLSFDGALPEMLLVYPGLKTNGILHAEWRYKRPPAKGSASGGLLVRTLKGDIWHQALAGNQAGGFFIGQTQNDGKPAKVPTNKIPGPTRVLPAGQWNVYEITFKDKTVSLFANGFTAADWLFCDVPKGYIGFKGDGAPIEFKNLKFKRLK